MKWIKNSKGMTLIEVILALIIFGIIVVTLSSVLSTGYIGITRSGHKAKAAYEAQKEMTEMITSGDFTGTQTLDIRFSGIPTIQIEVNLVESEEEINGSTSTMTSFIPAP